MNEGNILWYNSGSPTSVANLHYDSGNILFGISYNENAPDAQGFFDDIDGNSDLLTRINYFGGGIKYSFHSDDVDARYLFSGNVLGSFRIGNRAPEDLNVPLTIMNSDSGNEEKLVYLESNHKGQRIGLELSNAADGVNDNTLNIFNHGSEYPTNYYTDHDAGSSILVLQGEDAYQMSFATYNVQPINFWIGTEKQLEINSVGVSILEGIFLPNLPTSNPDNGLHQLWFNPTTRQVFVGT